MWERIDSFDVGNVSSRYVYPSATKTYLNGGLLKANY